MKIGLLTFGMNHDIDCFIKKKDKISRVRNRANNGSRMYHNFVANVITSDVKTVTERRDCNSNNQLACILLPTIG